MMELHTGYKRCFTVRNCSQELNLKAVKAMLFAVNKDTKTTFISYVILY